MAARRRLAVLAACYLAVFLLALAPRLHRVDVPMTGDEPLWLQRSIRFAAALVNGDPGATLQSSHPGVTTTWLAALGGGVVRMAHLKANPPSLLDPQTAQAWLGARRALALAAALLLAVVALLVGRLLGHPTGLLAGVLLAGEPWLVGHGRILHLDGLTSALLAICLLAALIYWERREGAHFLVLAGAALGLALLTRLGALAVVPVLALLAARHAVHLPWRQRWEVLLDLAALGACALLAVFLLWPAFRVDPLGTTDKVVRFAREQAGQPHELGNFFLGRPVAVPGPLFYPLVLALRLGPLVPLGLLGGALLALGRGAAWRPGPVAVLAFCALLLLLAITPAAKKLDRYALTAVPLVEVVAAAGLVGLARRVRGRLRPALPLLLGLAGLVQVALCATITPNYFAFYDPLLGGLATARRLVLVGWGEELRQVADYLNRQPRTVRTTVGAPRSVYDALRPQVRMRVSGLAHPEDLDYELVYVNAEQRGQPTPSPATLVLTVRVYGVEMARLYRLR